MIKLMHVNDYTIDTSQFRPLLNDKIVEEFEQKIADFVGAKYACSFHSATMAIMLALLEEQETTITVPSILPPVVVNAILCAGHKASFRDDVEWVGHSYVLHQFADYKIIDSAQQVYEGQYTQEANDNDLMIFSFYPTKPIGSSDGGMIVSNDKDKIDRLRILSRNGMSLEDNSWERRIMLPGWKMYMNSIQAYMATKNFEKLQEKTGRFEEIKLYYNQELDLSNTSNHLYRIRVRDNQDFIKKMKEKGIQCGVHYKALHNMEYCKAPGISLPKSDLEERTTASIPYNEALTDEEIERVVKEVKPYVITS
jgi:dTDP-4-amino-4,6-dideoxygalactose transaminase